MTHTALVLRSQLTSNKDPLFDITLPEAESFRLKMKAAVRHMTSMGSSLDEVIDLYALTGDDLVRFITHYPEGRRYSYLFEEKAAY